MYLKFIKGVFGRNFIFLYRQQCFEQLCGSLFGMLVGKFLFSRLGSRRRCGYVKNFCCVGRVGFWIFFFSFWKEYIGYVYYLRILLFLVGFVQFRWVVFYFGFYIQFFYCGFVLVISGRLFFKMGWFLVRIFIRQLVQSSVYGSYLIFWVCGVNGWCDVIVSYRRNFKNQSEYGGCF